MSFKDYARNRASASENITEGKYMIPLSDLIAKMNGVTVYDFMFGKMKESGEEYCIILPKELPDNYFFASSVLRSWIKEYMQDAFNGSLASAREACKAEGGWKFAVCSKRSAKSGKQYYAWTPIIDD